MHLINGFNPRGLAIDISRVQKMIIFQKNTPNLGFFLFKHDIRYQ